MRKPSFRYFAAKEFAEGHAIDLSINCDRPDIESYDAYDGEVGAYLSRHVTISMDYGESIYFVCDDPKILRDIAKHINACADWIEKGKK